MEEARADGQPDRFVAFLDVLGFSDLVRQVKHDQLMRIHENLLVPISQASLTRGKHRVVPVAGGGQIAVPDLSNAVANLLIVSDSIVVYSNADGMKDFIDVLAVMRNLLLSGF